MTVQEILEELARHRPDAQVIVTCESQGDGVFCHEIFADGDLVAAWETEE